jgi:hypothetical protein
MVCFAENLQRSKKEKYEIVKNDRDLIQFKNEQSWKLG